MFSIVRKVAIHQAYRIIAITKEENKTIFRLKTTLISIKQQNKIILTLIIVINEVIVIASVPKAHTILINHIIV